MATRHNQPHCVQVLLENGADANKRDNFGFQAIHDASLGGYYECLFRILQYQKFPVFVEGSDNITPIFYVIRHNHADCLKLLKEYMTISGNTLAEIYSKQKVEDNILQLIDVEKLGSNFLNLDL